MEKIVARLSLYRRLLIDLSQEKTENIYSHQLASLCGVSAAVVRRDLMNIGYTGNPQHGYQVTELLNCFNEFFLEKEQKKIILIGVGNMGKALLTYFAQGKSRLFITAAFDRDPNKINRVICNTHVYSLDQMSEIVKTQDIKTGIITVPNMEAQKVANLMINARIKGIMNLAPVRLRVPSNIYVENVDITMFLDRVVYFSYKP
ncbi:MAG: redox-sensing transcriptional repressor Rex [Spirochaetes bacterium]|nr:redox-sensing transcriptional repressor Rex [Spirochaetota bacterium]